MTEFNFNNSKIEQVNDSGDNLKVTENNGPVTVSTAGEATQVIGDHNQVGTKGEPWWKKGLAAIWKWCIAKLGF